MAFCYNRLWKMLIDRGMTRTEMRRAVGISTCTLARLSKGEDVTTSILKRICDTLGCALDDIVEYTPSLARCPRKIGNRQGKRLRKEVVR